MSKDFEEMTEEEILALPWDTPCIMYLPGRYYIAHGMVKIGSGFLCPNGADIINCIWRFDTEPQTWRLQMRTRFYASKNGDPFDDEDRKKWMATIYTGVESDALTMANNILKELGKRIAEAQNSNYTDPEWIDIRGDHKKAMHAIETTNVDWMHVQFKDKNHRGNPDGTSN